MDKLHELDDSELEKVVGGAGGRSLIIQVVSECCGPIREFEIDESDFFVDEWQETCPYCGKVTKVKGVVIG